MHKRWIRKSMFLVAMTMAILFITISGSLAQGVPFYWNYINVEIDVQENGDMLITENQEYEFSADYSNQRYRYIPLDKVDDIEDVTVEENNLIIPSKTGIENNQFWIRWQHELKAPAVHKFILKYKVIGGLHVDKKDTQVYWKAIFANRAALVKNAKVQVRLPIILTNKVTGFEGLGVSYSAKTVDDRIFNIISNRSLEPWAELGIKVVFPNEFLNLPQPLWQQDRMRAIRIFFLQCIIFPYSIITLQCLVFLCSVIAVIVYRKCCPNCKRITLKRKSINISYATTISPGKIHIIHHCRNCSYHNEYTLLTSANNGYGGDGGDGGGGGGGGEGGGGG
jgi:Predicted membrane protein (DUF2207)